MSLPDNKVVELLEISKTLANSKISTPFTIPDQYFENFQIQLNQLIQTILSCFLFCSPYFYKYLKYLFIYD